MPAEFKVLPEVIGTTVLVVIRTSPYPNKQGMSNETMKIRFFANIYFNL